MATGAQHLCRLVPLSIGVARAGRADRVAAVAEDIAADVAIAQVERAAGIGDAGWARVDGCQAAVGLRRAEPERERVVGLRRTQIVGEDILVRAVDLRSRAEAPRRARRRALVARAGAIVGGAALIV